MTILIPKYPVYVLTILSMCVFCGSQLYSSTNKEKTQERVELILNIFMIICIIIGFILMAMWIFGNTNGAK